MAAVLHFRPAILCGLQHWFILPFCLACVPRIYTHIEDTLIDRISQYKLTLQTFTIAHTQNTVRFEKWSMEM